MNHICPAEYSIDPHLHSHPAFFTTVTVPDALIVKISPELEVNQSLFSGVAPIAATPLVPVWYSVTVPCAVTLAIHDRTEACRLWQAALLARSGSSSNLHDVFPRQYGRGRMSEKTMREVVLPPAAEAEPRAARASG